MKKKQAKTVKQVKEDETPDVKRLNAADVVKEHLEAEGIDVSADVFEDSVPAIQADSVDELIATIDSRIMQHADNFSYPDEPEFMYAFKASLDYEEYLRLFRERMVVGATAYVPAALTAVGRSASTGNVKAAKILFEVAGLVGKQTGQQSSQPILAQINVNIPTIKDFINVGGDSDDES